MNMGNPREIPMTVRGRWIRERAAKVRIDRRPRESNLPVRVDGRTGPVS